MWGAAIKLKMLSIRLSKLDPFWVLTFAFVIISAFLVSDIANRIIVWKFRVPVYSPIEKTKRLSLVSGRGSRKSLLDIVSKTESQDVSIERNIPFLSTYKLIGTAVGKRGSSYAVFENISKRNQIILREGESTDGGLRLKEVGSGRVILVAGGRETTMEIIYGGEQEQEKDAKVASIPVSKPSDKSSELRRSLNRREVEATLEDLNKVMTQARIIPYIVKGKTEGYRVFSIKRGSIYTKIGLKNGDVMQGINGVKLDNPGKAYQLFQQLKDESTLTLDILRRNQKLTLTIDIG